MKFKLIIGMLLLSLLGSCQPTLNNRKAEQPANSFPASKTFILPRELDEISGITFQSLDSNLLYVIQDEEGILYTYSLKDEKIISEYTFAKSGDYEEITNDGKFFYVLRSDGTIFSFPVSLDVGQDQVVINKNTGGKGEYESLGYDSATNSLVLVCKVCKQDKGTNSLTGYSLPILDQGTLGEAKAFSISYKQIGEVDTKKIKSLKPSALSKRSKSDEWYLLSSIDNLLIIFDKDFNAIKVKRFDENQFEQPEGIAFDPQNRMFISSERNRGENALLFKYDN